MHIKAILCILYFFLTSITCGYCSFIAFNLWTLSNHHLWVFREQTLSQKHLFATTKTMRIERQFNIYSVFNSIFWELEQSFQNVKPEKKIIPKSKIPPGVLGRMEQIELFLIHTVWEVFHRIFDIITALEKCNKRVNL